MMLLMNVQKIIYIIMEKNKLQINAIKFPIFWSSRLTVNLTVAWKYDIGINSKFSILKISGQWNLSSKHYKYEWRGCNDLCNTSDSASQVSKNCCCYCSYTNTVLKVLIYSWCHGAYMLWFSPGSTAQGSSKSMFCFFVFF